MLSLNSLISIAPSIIILHIDKSTFSSLGNNCGSKSFAKLAIIDKAATYLNLILDVS